ncbi:hypothetical protein R9X47_17605 [Wukongibacter baidiensis]|uniref:hypothetical protein n=1 Tax=Wukongibacter baidiensis TaxID=1723361 RepID=UPI003D7FC139
MSNDVGGGGGNYFEITYLYDLSDLYEEGFIKEADYIYTPSQQWLQFLAQNMCALASAVLVGVQASQNYEDEAEKEIKEVMAEPCKKVIVEGGYVRLTVRSVIGKVEIGRGSVVDRVVFDSAVATHVPKK